MSNGKRTFLTTLTGILTNLPNSPKTGGSRINREAHVLTGQMPFPSLKPVSEHFKETTGSNQKNCPTSLTVSFLHSEFCEH